MALNVQQMFAKYLIGFSDWTSHERSCGDQLKIKGKSKGISQEAGTLLIPNILTEMNRMSNILHQAVRAAEVMKSNNHKKLEWDPVQGFINGCELLGPCSS